MAFVVDVFAQRIVGWRAATTKVTDLVLTPLRIAMWDRDRHGHPVEPGTLVCHSHAGSQGGFNLSSQHLHQEVCSGTTSGMDAHSDREAGSAVAWSSADPTRSGAGVLDRDRERHDKRRSRCRCRRVRTGGVTVVPRAWRHAIDQPGSTIGAASIVRRVRGDRAIDGPGQWSACDRPRSGSVAVDDLPRMAPERRHS